MKTGTPISVTANGVWQNKEGKTFYKWIVKMDNGDEGGVMTAKLDQDKWVVGKQVVYTIETNGSFTNLKLVEQKAKKSDVKDNGVITALSCISSACTLYAQSMYNNPERVIQAAEIFFQWAVNKSSLNDKN